MAVMASQLDGTLPDSWSAVTTLRNLELSQNKLRGTLPESWSALTALEGLSLFNNQLSGSLPDWLSTQTTLRCLTLENSGFSGVLPDLPFAQYTSSCRLRHNSFTCPLPADSSLCQPGPPTCTSYTTFRCTAGQCTQAPSGISKEECAEMCSPLFKCVEDRCVNSLSGGGVPLSTCQAACGPPPTPTPPPAPTPAACTCYPCGSTTPTTSFGECGRPAPDFCSATAGNPTSGCWSSQCGPFADCQCRAGTCTVAYAQA
jgi:hypothetical protein